MKRWILLAVMLVSVGLAAFAQNAVTPAEALQHALNDINARLGTGYTSSSNQYAYQYVSERVVGDHLGCPHVAATNQNPYLQTTVRFDFNFDDVYEWEYRYAQEADGSLKTVICQMPQASEPEPTAAPSTETPLDATSAPTSPTSPEGPIYGRGGPLVLPLSSCGGLPQRLVNGSIGRVASASEPNNLRQASDLTSAKIGQLNPEQPFIVMDGPFCNGGISWYLVGTGGEPLGWTAEGVNGQYLLQPFLIDALPIEPENVADLTNYGGLQIPTARAIDTSQPDSTVLVVTEDAITRLMVGFVPLAAAEWTQSTVEMLPVVGVFGDGPQHIWGVHITDAGFISLSSSPPSDQPTYSAYVGHDAQLVISGEAGLVAHGQFGSETLTVAELIDSGAPVVSLTLDAPLQDVAFTRGGMNLLVVTDEAIAIYGYEMGEGWRTQPVLSIPHALNQAHVVIDESGNRLALIGSNDDGASEILLVDGLQGDAYSTAGHIAPDGITYSGAAFNARGTFLAVYGSDAHVYMLDTTGQPFAQIAVSDGGIGTGQVGFSRDGLVMWVLGQGAGVQAFAVAAPATE